MDNFSIDLNHYYDKIIVLECKRKNKRFFDRIIFDRIIFFDLTYFCFFLTRNTSLQFLVKLD